MTFIKKIAICKKFIYKIKRNEIVKNKFDDIKTIQAYLLVKMSNKHQCIISHMILIIDEQEVNINYKRNGTFC